MLIVFRFTFYKRNGSLKDCEGSFQKYQNVESYGGFVGFFYFPHKLDHKRIFFTFHVHLYRKYVINSLEKPWGSELS